MKYDAGNVTADRDKFFTKQNKNRKLMVIVEATINNKYKQIPGKPCRFKEPEKRISNFIRSKDFKVIFYHEM